MKGIFNFFTLKSEGTRYKVFYFTDKHTADSFENKLSSSGIWFERSFDEERQRFLFGVHPSDLEECRELNLKSHAENYNGSFLQDRGLRYVALIITAVALGLAVAGYVMSE